MSSVKVADRSCLLHYWRDEHDVTQPDTELYASAFAIGDVDGWQANLGSVWLKTSVDPVHSGTDSLNVIAMLDDNAWAWRQVSSLVPAGTTIAVSAWVYHEDTSGSAVKFQLGVTSNGLSAPLVVPPFTWTELTYEVTLALPTNPRIDIGGTVPAEFQYWVDDVTLIARGVTEHVPAGWAEVELPTAEAELTLDAGWAPYVQGRILAPYTADFAEWIDPREGAWVDLFGSIADPVTEAFSFKTAKALVRSRSIDHEAGTITLDLAGEEARLQDLLLLDDEPDVSAYTVQTSLRSIINGVLAKIGASLAAGTPNANMTPAWDSENLAPNPGVEVDDAGWVVQSNGGPALTVARQTGSAHRGNARWRLTGTSTNTAVTFARVGGFCSVNIATRYAISVWVRASAAMQVVLSARRNTEADGTGTDAYAGEAAPVTLAANTWTRLTWITPGMPGNARGLSASVRIPVGQMVSGRTLDIDDVTVTEVNTATPYNVPDFDGATTNTSTYAYTWTGTANASTSRRTALLGDTAESLRWDPGVSAWEFLEPLLTASGLRLFCDEARVWRLVDTEYTKPGRTTIQHGVNVVRGTDIVSLDRASEWASGVIVRYRWRTASGQQERYDIAGDPAKGMLVEYDRPYPGPGAAAYILFRMQGKGRVQDVVSLSDYTAAPSREVSIALPGTLPQTGQIAAVTWDLRTGLMRVTSRALTDTPPEAWLSLAPGQSWTDSPPGESWIGEVV